MRPRERPKASQTSGEERGEVSRSVMLTFVTIGDISRDKLFLVRCGPNARFVVVYMTTIQVASPSGHEQSL